MKNTKTSSSKKAQRDKDQSGQKIAITQDILSNRKIVSPQKLKILVLCGNQLNNDELQFIHKCINLIKLDLSHNRITKINKKVQLSSLPSLKVMHLHNNRIQRIQGLQGIFDGKSLIYLTLHSNPVMNLPKVQHLIVNMMLALKIFNQRVVSVQQRSPNMLLQVKGIQVDVIMLQQWKSNSVSQTYFMKVLLMQINYIENIWLWSNPIIIIQRKWKELLNKKRIFNKKVFLKSAQKFIQNQDETLEKINILSNYFNQWKVYYKNLKAIKLVLKDENQEKDKLYLTYNLKQYKIELRNLRLRDIVRKTVRIIKQQVFKKKMAYRLYRKIHPLVYNFQGVQSFYNLAGVSENNKIIFNKNQKHLVDHFLANIAENYNMRQIIYSQVKFGKQKQYLSIRMMDPQTYQNKKIYSILTYLMWPSMRSVFLKIKKYLGKPKNSLIKIKPLNYIKNKCKFLTPQQYQKSVEIYKRIDKFMKVQYEESLAYLQCKNEDVMKNLIRYIYYHNQKVVSFPNLISKERKISLLQNFEQNFMMYTDKLITRTAAAVRIQQNWRRHVHIKNQKQSLQTKLKRNRASLKIQRFFRNILFYHRFRFHKNIQNDLKLIDAPYFLIHKKVYQSILTIMNCDDKIQLYTGIQLRRTLNCIQVGWIMEKYPFFPTIVKQNFPKNQSFEYASSWVADGYELLHINCKVSELIYCQQQFYRFTYNNIYQAKFRAAVLALLTYKLYDSKYIFPICNLGVYQQMIKRYYKFQILKDIKLSVQPQPTKFLNVKPINITGTFLYTQTYRLLKKDCKQVYIQFYQKKYKNFPVKYMGNIYYSLIQSQQPKQNIFLIQEDDLQKTKEKLIDSSNQVQKNTFSQKKNEIKQHTFKNTSYENSDMNLQSFHEQFFSIYKIDKKRLSLYDVGFTTQVKRETVSFTQQRQKLQTQLQTKREWIQSMQKTTFYKKQQTSQKKKNQLNLIREKNKKQKTQIYANKMIKELQRTEIINKKNQRIRDFKKRANSVKKEQETEFMQQGNFIMEQQLKMIIMRNKMKDKQSKDTLKKKNISTNLQKSKIMQSLSITSKQIQNSQKIDSAPIDIQAQVVVEVRNTKPSFNKRSKSRNQSIGAYIRDPSFVHGVFPEQYYPIQTKSKMKVIFPPL